jgi:hypothetical protein
MSAAGISAEREHADVNVSANASFIEGARSSAPQAYAIAELVDVLAFGEDSAALTFEHMARPTNPGINCGWPDYNNRFRCLLQTLPIGSGCAVFSAGLRMRTCGSISRGSSPSIRPYVSSSQALNLDARLCRRPR